MGLHSSRRNGIGLQSLPLFERREAGPPHPSEFKDVLSCAVMYAPPKAYSMCVVEKILISLFPVAQQVTNKVIRTAKVGAVLLLYHSAARGTRP